MMDDGRKTRSRNLNRNPPFIKQLVAGRWYLWLIDKSDD